MNQIDILKSYNDVAGDPVGNFYRAHNQLSGEQMSYQRIIISSDGKDAWINAFKKYVPLIVIASGALTFAAWLIYTCCR